jgi:non-specific serine/threonine protein kinase
LGWKPSSRSNVVILEAHPDGVWLVALAPVADAGLVPQAIVSALGIGDQPGRVLADSLRDYLRARRALLVLDNCEHVIATCAEVAEILLQGCPLLSILATSCEALNIAGESTYHVPSLTVPSREDRLPDASALVAAGQRSEAVALFVERATAVQPRFRITPENVVPVIRICQRLDGIPLAIELAAARIKALSVERVAGRLDDAFNLLTGGSRTALPRQQTLRATIDWSYSLLLEPERVLLRRLSVFSGGWTLEAAEAIGGDAPETEDQAALPRGEVFEMHAALVAKSLVIGEEQGDDLRYRMLETVRQYAGEKLAEAAEVNLIHARHLAYFVALAEEAEPHLRGPEQGRWFRRLELERPNVRGAIEWSREARRANDALRLLDALWQFWSVLGYSREGAELMDEVLSRPDAEPPTPERAKVLASSGFMHYGQQSFVTAIRVLSEALELGDRL